MFHIEQRGEDYDWTPLTTSVCHTMQEAIETIEYLKEGWTAPEMVALLEFMGKEPPEYRVVDDALS